MALLTFKAACSNPPMLLYQELFLLRPPDVLSMGPLETSPFGLIECPSSITMPETARFWFEAVLF